MKAFILALFVGLHTIAFAQPEHQEKITREIRFSGPGTNRVLYVYNINGSIKAEGYSGDQVLIDVQKTIKANDEAALTQGRQEIKLGIDQTPDTLFLYIDTPLLVRKPGEGRGRPVYDWQGNQPEDYSYVFDFTIRVPNQATVFVSTINQGNIRIENINGTIHASNVNGSIELDNIAGPTKASTVNGNVIARYKAIPDSKSSYKTLNGNVEIQYPGSLSADLKLKTTNGELYTDFDVTERLPIQVQKTHSNDAGGTTYKLAGYTGIRVGRGGPEFTFETFNGNITVRKLK